MKRICTFLLFTLLVAGLLASSAEGVTTRIPGALARPVSVRTGLADNPVIPGESPLTGLPIEEKKFVPILLQIDNNLSALPQWGIADADIMYEMPIQGGGWTRMTAMFSDQYPGEAGPVRSARIMHADLREGWDALLINYGKQEEDGSDLREALSAYGVHLKGLAIDGIHQRWEKYMPRVRYHMAPHNVTCYVSQMREVMLEQGYDFPVKPFKFTDEARTTGPAARKITVVHNGNRDTSSSFVYDELAQAYQRYVVTGPYMDLLKPEQRMYYANVVVLRTRLTFNWSASNPLMPDATSGTGAADIFIGGRYIAGAWSRANAQARTIFHDENGEEIAFHRGKTWIIQADVDTDVSFEGAVSQEDSLPETAGDGTFVPTADFEQMAPAELDPAGKLPAQQPVAETKEQQTEPAAQPAAKEPAPTQAPPANQAAAPVQPQQPATPVQPQQPATPVQPQQPATPAQPQQPAAPAEDDTLSATVLTSSGGPLNMRKTGSLKSDIIARIPNGAVVQIIDRGEEWSQVTYQGKTGFVVNTFLVFED